MSTQPSCIADKSKLCIAGFEALSKLLTDAEVEEEFRIKQLDCNDELSRFKLWAGNIGALQDSRLASSLEHRLRDSPRVANQVIDLLEEMIENLEDVRAILCSERPNQTDAVTYLQDCHEDDADGIRASAQTEERSEIQEIFGSVADITVELFKLSMLIRKATPRDRYIKAAAAKEPFEERYDIAHVEHKFPKLARRDQAWLKTLLGKAITQRREFLRYARDHRHKLSAEQDPQTAEDIRLKERRIASRQVNQQLKRDAGSVISGARQPTTLAPTKASTLQPLNLEDIEYASNEEQSVTSFAVSMEQDDEKIRVVPLSHVSKGKFPFECPYCWQIVGLRHERAWRKHVLKDLRPYLCTFNGCGLTLFLDRSTWFNHELETHRSQWHCQFCRSQSPYTSRAAFESHLKRQHNGKFLEAQLPTLSRICQQPVDRIPPSDCPFCDEWGEALQAQNAHLAGGKIVVTPVEFRNHVAAHMEQLALFAISVSPEADEDASAKSNDVNHKQEKSLSHIQQETLSTPSFGYASSIEQVLERERLRREREHKEEEDGLKREFALQQVKAEQELRDKEEAIQKEITLERDKAEKEQAEREEIMLITLEGAKVEKEQAETEHRLIDELVPALASARVNENMKTQWELEEQEEQEWQKMEQEEQEWRKIEQEEQDRAKREIEEQAVQEFQHRKAQEVKATAKRKKEEEELRQKAILEWQQKQQEGKDRAKREKEQREQEIKDRLKKDFGLSDDQVEKVVNKETTATTQDGWDMSRPTHTKFTRRHVSLETLEAFELPYHLDFDEPETYVIVTRRVPQRVVERLWEHTAKLREERIQRQRRLEMNRVAEEGQGKGTIHEEEELS